jgi:hypothetical protein
MRVNCEHHSETFEPFLLYGTRYSAAELMDLSVLPYAVTVPGAVDRSSL